MEAKIYNFGLPSPSYTHFGPPPQAANWGVGGSLAQHISFWLPQAMTGQVGNSYVVGSPPQNQDDGKHAISVIEVA